MTASAPAPGTTRQHQHQHQQASMAEGGRRRYDGEWPTNAEENQRRRATPSAAAQAEARQAKLIRLQIAQSRTIDQKVGNICMLGVLGP